NVAPTANLSATPNPVNEGSSVFASLDNALDPSNTDTSAGFHYAFDCEGGSLAAATYGSSGASQSTTCTYDDGLSVHSVSARIFDKDGDSTFASTSVQVDNVPPTADLTNDGPVNEGSPATASFSNQHDPSTADTAAGSHYVVDRTD